VLFGAAMALGLALAMPRRALACSCAERIVTAPADGDVDVPPNTKLWHAEPFRGRELRFTLTGPEGEVPLQTLELRSSGYGIGHLSTPERDLTSGASYRFAVCPGTEACTDLSRFTVGVRRAEKPPIPLEQGKRSDYYRPAEPRSSCGPAPERFVTLNFDWEGLLLLIDVAGANKFPADPRAVLAYAVTAEEIKSGGGVRVGSGACRSNWPYLEGDLADAAPVRFGAVNLAGEFSGWTDPVTIELPDGCGCRLGGTVSGGSAGWIAAPVGLCLLLGRRRLRARRPGTPPHST
jgi:hypothetical protein